ncbi:hypothetical protein ABPG75_012847 [Micractinium tetrahymenae]
MASDQPLHTNCRFSGRRVCRCVYGNATILAGRSDGLLAPDAAEAYMRRARAAWRLLHHPDSPALHDNEPVVLWLPKLEKRAPQPAPSAPVLAAAARVQQAEAAARAAVAQAASLAAAAGLPVRPPEGLQAQLGGMPLNLGGLMQADHSELERQVQAVLRAQEARQAAAAGGAPAGMGAAPLATPDVPPLSEGAAAATGTPSLAPFGEGYEPRGASTASPPKDWLLTMRDFTPALQGKHVQTFWPDGGRWWPAVVLSVSLPARTCTLYYETGHQEGVELPPLVHAGEVAWLAGPPATGAAASGGSQGAAGSTPARSGGRPPLSAGLHSPSQQSLHSTGQQQQQQQPPGSEGPAPKRLRAASVPAQAAQQVAKPAPARAGSVPPDLTFGRASSAADRGLARPAQPAEAAGLQREGSTAALDASSDGAVQLLPVAGSLAGAALRGSEPLLDTSELPDLPQPASVQLEKEAEQGQGPGEGAAPAADEEGEAPAEQEEQHEQLEAARQEEQQKQPEQPQDGPPMQQDAPPAAEQQEQQEQQPNGGAPASATEQQEGAPPAPIASAEQQAEGAGPSDVQQAQRLAAAPSGVEAQQEPAASPAEQREQATLVHAAEQPDGEAAEAAVQQEQLQPAQQQEQLRPAEEEPSPELQAAPEGGAASTLAQPENEAKPDAPAAQL